MPILVLNVVLVSYSLTQVVVGRETCVPAKIVARLGPGTLMAELMDPELRSGAIRHNLTPGRWKMKRTQQIVLTSQ